MSNTAELVYEGSLEGLPPMESTMIRVFSSSTFTDMAHERNYLMKESIPKIRQYCFENGLTFQLVDMRWGVRDEASNDHTTNEVVLGEVEVSKKLSRGPYLLAFLGDKYGSRPVPSKIVVGEFKLLTRSATKLGMDLSLVEQWFRRDDNAEPPIFYLLPITKIFPNYDDDKDGHELQRKRDRDKWANVEASLMTTLRKSADQAFNDGLIDADTRHKYYRSVTEVEIQSGILDPETVKDKVICYFRSFMDINIQDKLAWRFTDLIANHPDDEASELRESLKVNKVIPKLGPDEYQKYNLYWCPVGIDPNNEDHAAYLNNLCQDFEERMKSMIERSLKTEHKKFGIDQKIYYEILHHSLFAAKRISTFCGRSGLLETVKQKMSMCQSNPVEKVQGDIDMVRSETSSSASLYQTMNGDVSQKDLDELKQIKKEHKAAKKNLTKMNVVYTHADLDLDRESDPNWDPKTELVGLPPMTTYSRPLILYGTSGSGKTTVMAKIAHLSKTWFPNSVQILRFFGTSPSSSSIREVLLGICLQIWHLYKVKPPQNLDIEGDFHVLKQYFCSLLMKLNTRDRPLVIILDSVDQLQLTDHSNSMHWMPQMLPPDVHIVLSTLPQINNCLDNIKNVLPHQDRLVQVPPLSLETAEAMIKTALHSVSRRLTKNQWRHLLDKIAKDGQPLYVKLLSDVAVKWKSSTVMTKSLVGNHVKDAITQLFQAIEKEHGDILISKLFGYMCAARDGLSLDEFQDVLSLDDDVLQDTFLYHLPPDPENIQYPSAVLTRATQRVEDYVVSRRSGTTRVFSWYHRQFSEVARQRFLPKDRAVNIHGMLADYFLGAWHQKRKPLKLYKKKSANYTNAIRSVPAQPIRYCVNVYNTRKLIELPFHLIKSQRYQVFRDVIACSYEFLYAKCKTLGIAEVVNDLKLCTVAMDAEGYLGTEVYEDIKSVYDVLMLGVSVIRKDPNHLPVQLMSRLGPKKAKSAGLDALMKEVHQWCKGTTSPLLVPRSCCMPGPGGLVRGTLDVEMYHAESVRERDKKHVMYLQEDTSQLFVLAPASSRLDNAYLHMYHLGDNFSHVYMTKLTRDFMAISFLANQKYLHLKDKQTRDHIHMAASSVPVKLPHEADCVTVTNSGKYIVFSSESKVYVCLSDSHGCVTKIKHEIDTDQRDKLESEADVEENARQKKTGSVACIMTSPDEKYLAVYNTLYKFFKIWGLEGGSFRFDAKPSDYEVDKFSAPFSEYSDIPDVSLITKDNLLIYRKTGYQFLGQLCVVNLEKRKIRYTLDSESQYKLTMLSLHPTHRYLAAATSETVVVSSHNPDKSWKVWDVHTGKLVTRVTVSTLYNNSYGMDCVQLFGSDKIFAASCHHGMNGLIHISYCGSVDSPSATGIPICALASHTMRVHQIIVSSDNKLLISASEDNSVKTWDLGKVMVRFNDIVESEEDEEEEMASNMTAKFEEQLNQIETTHATGVCSDAKEVFASLTSGEMVIQDIKSNQVKRCVSLADSPLIVIRVGSAGDFVIAATEKGNIIVWDIAKNEVHKSLQCNHKLSCMAEAGDILVGGQMGMEAKGSIWNIRTGELVRELKLLYSFYNVAVSASGTKFVSSMFDFPVVVSVSSQQDYGAMDMTKLDTQMSVAKCIAVSPDETLALCGSIDGSIRVVTMDGKYKYRLGQKSTVVTAVFSPDSQYIVSGGYKSIYIWCMEDASLRFKIRKHDNFVLNIKFNEKGTHFLTTGRDKRIVVWDFQRGISLSTFYADSQVDHVAFTRRGYVVYVPDGVSSAASLKPNHALKQMLKGKYSADIGTTITSAQGVALGFSSQKIQEQADSKSGACKIL